MNKKKQLSGGARLKLAGKVAVTLGLTREERDLLLSAAVAERRPLATYILYHALEAAKEFQKKSSTLA